MFDIGWTELLVIAVVAVIIVGPKDLPGMLRTLGRYAGKLKRTAGEFRSQFDDALRESELDELRTSMSDMGSMNPVNQIRDSVNESLNPLKDSAGDIKKGIEGAAGGGASGRMNTDPAPSRKPAAKAAQKKSPAAGKSAPAKKAAPRKKAAAAKPAPSGSAAKAKG